MSERTTITYWRVPRGRSGFPAFEYADEPDPLYRYAYRTELACLDAQEAWLRDRLADHNADIDNHPIGGFDDRMEFPDDKGRPTQEFRVRDREIRRDETSLHLNTRWETRWIGTLQRTVEGMIDGVAVTGKAPVVTVLRDWHPWKAPWQRTADISKTGWGYTAEKVTIEFEWAPE